MKVVITGSSGLIGRALCLSLAEAGYEIVAISRNPDKYPLKNQGIKPVNLSDFQDNPLLYLTDEDYILINLAGENIASGRWSKSRKQKILRSRLSMIDSLVNAIDKAGQRPSVIIQASAIGYYDNKTGQQADEMSLPGSGFLTDVVLKWEKKAGLFLPLTRRLIVIRTGIVLSHEGGAWPQLVKPLKFNAGFYPGSGSQWQSWIHINDEVKAIRFLMDRTDLSGVFNLCAPKPVKMKEMLLTSAQLMNKKVLGSVPSFLIRLALGEMGNTLLLSGEYVIPQRLIKAGFKFDFPEMESALKDLVVKYRM